MLSNLKALLGIVILKNYVFKNPSVVHCAVVQLTIAVQILTVWLTETNTT